MKHTIVHHYNQFISLWHAIVSRMNLYTSFFTFWRLSVILGEQSENKVKTSPETSPCNHFSYKIATSDNVGNTLTVKLAERSLTLNFTYFGAAPPTFTFLNTPLIPWKGISGTSG